MNRIQNIEGIILRKREFMENDLIITLLDTGGEFFELICKGARSQNSKRKGQIEAMNLINGTAYKSTSHLYLQSMNCISSFSNIKDDYNKILEAQLLLEIISKTIQPNDPHPEVYTLLLETLESMNREDHPLNLSFAITKLAHHLGYLPSFKNCGACHSKLEEDNAVWSRENGVIFCVNCRQNETPIPLKYRKAFEFFRIASREDASKISVSPEEKNILLNYIPNIFHSHMDRPFKCLDLLIN